MLDFDLAKNVSTRLITKASNCTIAWIWPWTFLIIHDYITVVIDTKQFGKYMLNVNPKTTTFCIFYIHVNTEFKVHNAFKDISTKNTFLPCLLHMLTIHVCRGTENYLNRNCCKNSNPELRTLPNTNLKVQWLLLKINNIILFGPIMFEIIASIWDLRKISQQWSAW